MTNRKITLLTNGIYPYVMGGMQKHSYYLTKYLAKNRVEVELYHFVANDKPLVEELKGFTKEELKYITHHCFNFPKLDSLPGHYIRENKKLSEMYLHSYLKQRDSSTSLHFAQNDESPKDPITKRQNHSITNSPYHPFTTSPHHPIYAQGFTAHAFIKAKKKGLVLPEIIVNFHGLEMFQKAPSFRVKLEHLLLSSAVKYSVRGADISVSLGGKLTGILKKIVAKRIVEQGIGIEDSWLIDKVENIEHTNLRFVFIGRYERRKGIEELNEVLKELDFELNTPFQFDFIGPITDDKKIPRLSLGMTISYHGAINDENKIKEILRESDILVSPSWSEGMPTVILEAMASGCAIIATDVGAVAEQVDASNGWLIEAGNKKQLKETIVEAISLPKKRLLQKKQNSIKKIKDNFLWEDVIKKTITELSSKVEEPHNPACAKDLNKGK